MANERSHHRHISPTTVIIVSTLFIFCSVSVVSRHSGISKKGNWDIIIFTQNWPVTVCLSYEKSGGKCNLPADKSKWTIHGIWPTKIGTKGPWFCNTSLHFHIEEIYGIQDQLEGRWTPVEVHKKKNMLWKHEWEKHGTCAVVLPQLSNEFKYFSKGLEWNQNYDMKIILNQAGIVPRNDAYDPQDIWMRVKNILGKKPFIMCYDEGKTGISYLQEIRICFSKDLSLVDCDGIESLWEENPLIQCNLDRPTFYLETIPDESFTTYKSDHPLVTAFKTVKLLQWVSV